MHCLNCSKELLPAKGRKSIGDKKYCNNVCQHEYQTSVKMQNFLDGKYVGRLLQFRNSGDGEWTRRLLKEKQGYVCACCRISSWQGMDLTLEVNHKDGDAMNNVLENLEFLCANCHSQTDTYKAKNKNSSRAYRRK
jgi:hypothetical protein